MTKTADAERLAAWTQVFDRIEAITAAAEAQVQDITTPHEDESGPWEVPTVSGPIPEELVERARELWGRQEFLLEVMPILMTEMRQQMQIIEKHTYATSGRPSSTYIDVQA